MRINKEELTALVDLHLGENWDTEQFDAETFVEYLDYTGRAYDVTPENAGETLADLLSEAVEAWLGYAFTAAEFTRQFYDEAGLLADIPDEIEGCINWEAVWSSALRHDITEIDTGDLNNNFFRQY